MTQSLAKEKAKRESFGFSWSELDAFDSPECLLAHIDANKLVSVKGLRTGSNFADSTSLVGSSRHNGVGFNSMCARASGILAPLLPLLTVYHHSIPIVIYGAFPVVAGLVCLLLPETLNVELQEDAAEVQ